MLRASSPGGRYIVPINALTELPRDFAVLIKIAVHILVVDAISLYGLASMTLSTKIMTPPRLPALFLTAGWPTTMYLFCSLLQMVWYLFLVLLSR